MDYILGILSGFFMGVIISARYLKYLRLKAEKKIIDEIEGTFSLMLSKFGNLSFTKRINSYSFFSYRDDKRNWEISYHMKKGILSIFEGETCISTSSSLTKSKVVKELISKIRLKWGADINNIMIIGDSKVSINFVISEQKKMSNLFTQSESIPYEEVVNELTIDDVLDKINKVGINNLSIDEKEFLKNASK